jgi:hypothetical protein
LALAICEPAACCLLTADGPLSQALSSAIAEIPSAKDSPGRNPIVFNPAIVMFSQTAQLGTKKEQLSRLVESNLPDLS